MHKKIIISSVILLSMLTGCTFNNTNTTTTEVTSEITTEATVTDAEVTLDYFLTKCNENGITYITEDDFIDIDFDKFKDYYNITGENVNQYINDTNIKKLIIDYKALKYKIKIPDYQDISNYNVMEEPIDNSAINNIEYITVKHIAPDTDEQLVLDFNLGYKFNAITDVTEDNVTGELSESNFMVLKNKFIYYNITKWDPKNINESDIDDYYIINIKTKDNNIYIYNGKRLPYNISGLAKDIFELYY